MKRSTHGQQDSFFCARRFEFVDCRFNARRFARDNGLTGAVEVDCLHFAERRNFRADLNNRFVIKPDNRRHCAFADGNGFLHEFTALVNQTDRVGKFQRARRDQSGIFAETVPAGNVCRDAFGFQNFVDDDADDENRGLSVRRQF